MYLRLTVRFLDDRYHGLLDRGGPPEWPPSPFRLFQAIVAGVSRRCELDSPVGESLNWVQKLAPPIIIAPSSKTGQATTRFVPNNDGDRKFERRERLTAKPTIPTLFLLEPDQNPEVHYVWDITDMSDCPVNEIEKAARSLTTLGWGIDMAFADAQLASQEEVQQLKGVRWYPKQGSGSFEETLRVPTYDVETGECTLCDLRHCHSTAMNRIEHGKPLKTVDKPKVFERVLYSSVERPIARPWKVFKLVDVNGDPTRYPHAKLIHIAGMVRHLAIEHMKSDPPSWKNKEPSWLESFVCGHRGDAEQHQQISYVPLPSIGDRHGYADAMIRNVMLVAPMGCDRELEYIAERLNGEQLVQENQVRTVGPEVSHEEDQHIFLDSFNPPKGRFIRECYLPCGIVWQSVTPVILDGHDDKKPEKTRKLIQLALQRVGSETPCEFTWQAFPYFKNCLSAHKYDRNGRHTGYHRPHHLKHQTAVHVRLTFDQPIAGPLTLGAGRHCGFGLMAAIAHDDVDDMKFGTR